MNIVVNELNAKEIDKIIKEVNFEKGNGIIPAIAQDNESKKILMLAYMNEQALRETLKTGYMTYWSRSRGILWKKGEQSGHRQIVKEIFVSRYILSVYIDCITHRLECIKAYP